jgi:hypothetical protein
VPLVDIKLSINGSDLPSDVRAFLREAYLRVGQFVRNNPIRVSGFIGHCGRQIKEVNKSSS